MMKKEDLKIVFFGTPEFAVESLDRLVRGGYNIAAVVTATDKPAGRGHKLLESDVKKYAVQHGMNILQPTNLKDPAFQEELNSINADLFIVIAFRMMPKEVWGMPRLGTFNLHASLLPKYRGAAPINRAVMNGDKVTGVTTFFLKHEIDTGDIIMQRQIEIGDDENVGSVYDRLMRLGADMVVETVNDILEEKVTTTPQPDGDFTPAPKIFSEDCMIDWNRTASEVHNHVRGLSPYPCAKGVLIDAMGREIDVKIRTTALCDHVDLGETQPGKVSVNGKRMIVACGMGNVEILELQPAGKKPMSAEAFLLGYKPVKFLSDGR